MRDESLLFVPRIAPSLQLDRLFARIFGERRLKGAVFLQMPKPFDTVWIDGLYRLIFLNFPSC